jgi:hypothetical protein
MPDNWPPLYEQINAVLAAPIPFFIAVVVIAWAAWHAWQWRFKAVFEKQKELYDLSRSEVEHWKDIAQRTTIELSGKIELLQKEQNLTTQTREQLDQLLQATSQLGGQLRALGQANSSHTSSGVFLGAPELVQHPPPRTSP